MKTIKQIADELGMNKQRVYRFIQRNRIKEAYRDAQAMWYDDAAQARIAQEIGNIGADRSASNDADSASFDAENDAGDAVVAILREQLSAKDRQIEELTAALSNVTNALNAAQALHAATAQKRLTEGKGLMSWFRKQKGRGEQ